jgi:uncharacterized protein (DUF885 family)
MNLRITLFLAVLAAGCATAPPGAGKEPGDSNEAEALALSDAYVAAYMEAFPEWATVLGYPRAQHGRLSDHSLAGVARWQAQEDAFLAKARALPSFTPGSRAWVARGILISRLESAIAVRPCRDELWSVGSISGWPFVYQQFAAAQPVGSEATRTEAIQRLHRLAEAVDVEITNQREGLRLGYIANRENTERMVRELEGLLSLPAGRWPVLITADNDGTPKFREALIAVVRDELLPATRRHRDFLASDYLPKARASFGVGGIPAGEACYRGAIRRGTTQEMSPKELHALGLKRLEELRTELAAVGEKAFGTNDLRQIRGVLDRSKPVVSPETAMARASAAVERARLQLPRAFHRLPRGKLVVLPIPEFQAKEGATAHYSGAMKDGAYDGIYWFNTLLPPRPNNEATAFHEGVPGHHLQHALAAEGGDAPDIARYTRNTPYVEGWALYAERLADELGVYSSEEARAGMVLSEVFRAARLVVDTGIHAMGWSREQALSFLLVSVSDNRKLYEGEVDRYSAWPGQALGYMVGALEIRKLREDARATLGPRFDLAAFHDLVLEGGSLPMPMLRERVTLWAKDGAAQAAVGGQRP